MIAKTTKTRPQFYGTGITSLLCVGGGQSGCKGVSVHVAVAKQHKTNDAIN